jgi:hypothetical protein
MQKIATKIFTIASITFGITGICLVIFGGPNDNAEINQVFLKILQVCVFIILPSFALSVAGKYLSK